MEIQDNTISASISAEGTLDLSGILSGRHLEFGVRSYESKDVDVFNRNPISGRIQNQPLR